MPIVSEPQTVAVLTILIVSQDPAVTGVALSTDFASRDRVGYCTSRFVDVLAITKLTMAQPGAHLDKAMRKFCRLKVHQGTLADTG